MLQVVGQSPLLLFLPLEREKAEGETRMRRMLLLFRVTEK